MSARAGVRRDLERTGVMAILDGALVPAGRMGAMARRLARAGVRVIQLRMKRAEAAEILRAARGIKSAAPGIRLILNDRCDLAVAAGAAGVHLGQDDLPVSAARRILGPGRFVGISGGTRTEIRRAVAARPDCVSIGPFFRTGTKHDAGAALGETGFRRLAVLIPPGLPILAIGGITPDNGAVPLVCGARAVAVASGLTGSRDPGSAARRLLGIVRRMKRIKQIRRRGPGWKSSIRS